MPAEPILTALGDGLWVVWPDRATLEFARLSEHADSLGAEATVVSTAVGELSWSRLNLASAPSRNGLAKILEMRDPGQDWAFLLDRSCRIVAKHVRTGEPAVPLIAEAPTAMRWLVDALIPAGHITVVCGDGGAGKSYLALALALAGLTGRAPSHRWSVGPCGG